MYLFHQVKTPVIHFQNGAGGLFYFLGATISTLRFYLRTRGKHGSSIVLFASLTFIQKKNATLVLFASLIRRMLPKERRNGCADQEFKNGTTQCEFIDSHCDSLFSQ